MFAYNNSNIDYISMALCNALLIKKHLKCNNVALVTNEGSMTYLKSITETKLIEYAFDVVIYNDVIDSNNAVRTFHDTRYTKFKDRYQNINRINAYNITPFEQTVVLDTDYLMLDSSMDLVWDCDEDFMCNRKTVTLDHEKNSFGFDNRFSEMSIPLYWATAIYFKKSHRSKSIFELINFIKENYEYYGYLYSFQPCGYFRNDFALSIAIHMTDNCMEYKSVKPLPINHILVSLDLDEVHAFKKGKFYITSESKPGEFKLHSVINNVHIMNKRAILRYKDEIIEYANS